MKKNLLFITEKLSKMFWLLSAIIFISFGVKAGKLGVVPTVTYTTENVAAGNVLQGTYPGTILYILKIQASTDAANVSWINFTPTGSFTSTDISQYSLYWNTTNSFTGATLTQSVGSGTGSGVSKTINAGSTNIPAGQSRYFFIVAAISSTAVDGHTIKVNGSANPATADIYPAPIIVNSQTDIAGIQTITAPKPTVSTESLAASNVLQGTNNTQIYIVKIIATSGPLVFSSLKIKTLGTYTPSDVGYFQIYKGLTNSFASATYLGYHGLSITGSGQIITLGGYTETIPMGEARYYFITANISSTATDGHTIKVDGSANPTEVVGYTTTPIIINNQTDIAGVQTITAPKPTVSTETSPASNVLQGSNNNPIYIVKIEATSEPLTFSSLKIKTLGTYTASDVSYFQIYKGSTNSFASATYLGYHGYSITGNGQIITLGGYSETIPMGEARYYFITANISATGIDGHTIKVDGSANPLEIAGNTTPVIVNNQTDIAGAKTIVAPRVTYTTETVPALSVLQGEQKVLVYTLKIASTTHQVNPSAITFNITGNYTNNDVQYFQVWTNTTNTLTGATNTGTNTSNSTGSGESFYQGAATTIPVGESRYIFLTASLKPTAIEGHTIKVNGSSNPVNVVFNSTNPIVTNNQTDVTGIQTIVAPRVTYTTESVPPLNVLQNDPKVLIYTLKIASTTHPVGVGLISYNITGTYTNNDVQYFQVWTNTTNTLTGATNTGTNTSNSTGTGEVFIQGAAATIPFGESRYFFLTALLKPTSIVGHTIKVNGSVNPIIVTYNYVTPIITNNQSDIAGKQTIGTPLFTYTTESSTAKIIAKGTANHPFYTLKVVGGSVGGTITNLSVQTAGTYNGSDIGSFSLYRNSTPSITGATLLATDNTSTGNGETLTFPTGYVEIDAGTTTYLIVRANVNSGATSGNTFFINGGANPITTTNSGLVATITNSQTNVAGIQTIGVPPTFTSVISNIAANTTVNLCTAVVNYTPTTAGSPTPTLSYIFTGATTGSGSGSGSGAVFNKGVTNVVISATNACLPDATQSFTVTISDAQLPTITAPANVTATTNTACTATGVVLGTPTTADNCSVASVTNNAPTAFPLGVTTVIWTVTDGSGNIKTANQTVTVTDNILPTITAPANVTATTNTACTATGVVLGTPTTADNCSVASVTNNAPTTFPLGVTTVIWTVTDGSGNIKTANQTVTVTDNILPTITAPANVTATTNTACTATGVALGLPTTADNCSVASTTNNAPTAFPIGVTTVVWTVTDGAGNIKTANQTVTVTDNVLPTITPPANVTANTNTACTATGVVLGTPTTADNCSVASTTNNAPTAFPLGATTVIWTVTDGAGNTKTATQTVTITDNVLPTITAPANVIATGCTSATGVVLGTPTTADNCSVASTTNNAPTTFPAGATTVTWTVTDGSGNIKTATQTVTVVDNILPTITAPANVTATTNTACTATGVVLGTPTTADNCSVASVTNNAPTAFPLGATTVVWTVTDGAGNIKIANQTVTVTDNILPTISAPANVNATTNTACTATGVALGTPTTADNCSVASTTNNAPTAFPLGATTVIWTVTDGSGNTKTATQTVTITDNVLPTITAPANVNATTNTACTTTGVVLGSPITADNCSVASTTNNAPTVFPLGITTVIWTVTDGAGNIKTANQTVTITDNTLPTITAPANVTAIINSGCTATGVVLGTPTTSDNCSVASTTNNAPTAFPIGVTTVVWTVTDGAGNIKTANQTVTVTDNVLPTITAPTNVTATTNTGCTATGVVLGTPITADNCSVASTTNDAPTAFPLGATTVIWTVTDGSGNTKTATQTVTITDNILPTITAPANVNAITNTSCTASGVVLGSPITADNCSVASTTNNAPTTFPIGSTTVIWTVTDGAGNTKTANQTVTVTSSGGSSSIVISTQSGDWNTPSTWQCGDLPTATKVVQVQSGHIVNISSDVHAKDVKFLGTGKLNYTGTAGKLFLNQ